jgi:hypothetical protein
MNSMAFGKRAQPPSLDDLAGNIEEPALKSDAAPVRLSEEEMRNAFEAGHPLAQMMFDAYGEAGGRVHAETLLGAAAALVGEFALRATVPASKLDHMGGWVLGGAPDGLLYADEKPGGVLTIWTIVGSALSTPGSHFVRPSIEDIVRRNSAQIGKSPYPPLTIPANHFPHEWSPNATLKLRSRVQQMAAARSLNPRQTALALGWALFHMLRQSKQMGLDPTMAATLVGEVMIGVSRMMPLQKGY